MDLENKDEKKSIYENIKTKQIELKDINFVAKKGEITAIIGDTGSGKSSLLYAILG